MRFKGVKYTILAKYSMSGNPSTTAWHKYSPKTQSTWITAVIFLLLKAIHTKGKHCSLDVLMLIKTLHLKTNGTNTSQMKWISGIETDQQRAKVIIFYNHRRVDKVGEQIGELRVWKKRCRLLNSFIESGVGWKVSHSDWCCFIAPVLKVIRFLWPPIIWFKQ